MSAPVLASSSEKVQKVFGSLIDLYRVPTERIKPRLEFRSRMKKNVDGLFYLDLDLAVIRRGLTLQQSIRTARHEFCHFLQKYLKLPYSNRQADAFEVGLNPLDIIPLLDWDEIEVVKVIQVDLEGYYAGPTWKYVI